jgi:hypothetical protein
MGNGPEATTAIRELRAVSFREKRDYVGLFDARTRAVKWLRSGEDIDLDRGLIRIRRSWDRYIRFEAAQPNETWQSDVTHWRLADAADIEIRQLARRPLAVSAVKHRAPARQRRGHRHHVPRRDRLSRRPSLDAD